MTKDSTQAEETCEKDHHGLAPQVNETEAPRPEDDAAAISPTTTNNSDELTYPEGGCRAWLVVLGSFCAMGAVFGLINSSAVFESYFKENQLRDYSHSQIGWIFSLYLFLVFFVGILVGPVFDRRGPRALVAVGACLIVASLMLLSISKTYYQIMLTYSVLGGIGGALLNCPAYGAIAHFFHARRGLATGIATTAGGVGGIVFPLLLQALLGKNGVGFAWSCRIMGFILLALCACANLCIRSRLSPRSGRENEDDDNKGSSVWPDVTILRDKGFAMTAAGLFFTEWGLFVPLTYLVSFAKSHGANDTDSSAYLSVLNAGSVLGRCLPGLLADKVGRFNVIIATVSLCVVSVLGLWLPAGDSRALLVVFCVAFGFASGSNLGLSPVCIGQFCDSRDYGRYYSTASMMGSFGTLTSVPIGGALLGLGGRGGDDGGWTGLIVFTGVAYILALACYVLARTSVVGLKLMRRV